ncbi:hypothetical protein MKW98_000877 [Papaver atlanticum]|uniref:Uncharacterized protein n=1 Tax=Papaver atlanticum TaxID=357466 RepID=A0AAD4XDR1_9MAGN|nr:hypothetical protein MKW98_000877 [Papaver atlanticum]
MGKSSSLVIVFFFVVSVVLQSAYADSGAAASSPDIGVCDPSRLVDIGNYFSNCDMCHPACLRNSYSASTCFNSTNTGGFVTCKCCAPFSPSGTALTTTTSLAFLSFSLFLSFILNRLFI